MASGGRHGLAQSLFQVGGNVGSATGPILAAFIVIAARPGQHRLVLGGGACWRWRCCSRSATGTGASAPRRARRRAGRRSSGTHLSRRKVGWSLAILLALVFSKSFYQTSLGNYYTFYLIEKFGLSVESAQIYLFVFLAAVAVGTLIGGPVGDRIGRKAVIWGSILGVMPFTLALPYVGLVWTAVLTVDHRADPGIGLPRSSSMRSTWCRARSARSSGLFFGLSFGLAGIGAALLGRLADMTSIDFVYRLCAFLPLLGLLTVFPARRRPAGAPGP